MAQDGLTLGGLRRLEPAAEAAEPVGVEMVEPVRGRETPDDGPAAVPAAGEERHREVSVLRPSGRQGRGLAREPRGRSDSPPPRVPGMRRADSRATSASTKSRTWSSRRTAGASDSTARSSSPVCSRRAKSGPCASPRSRAIADKVEATLQEKPEREITAAEIGALRHARAEASRQGRLRPVCVGLPQFPRPRRVHATS